MGRELQVTVYGEPAGVLMEDDAGRLSFAYSEGASPLSVRMPVRSEVYGPEYAEPFFENLAPEGAARQQLAEKFHLSEENAFSLLAKIGGDCAGAVALLPKGARQSHRGGIKEIRKEELSRMIDRLPENPLLTGLRGAPRLSLAGAQSKFAVIKDSVGRYFRSDDEHPTTHIIKIGNQRYPELLQNEFFCMRLAKEFFDDAVEVQLNAVNGRKFLEIQRFDRVYKNGRLERLHQEDFCQVLGLLSRMKYHADGGPGVRTIYRAIMEHSDRKAADVFKLVKMLVYNYLIGNTDAHAKNFSFLHTARENGVVLSPAYDLLAVDIYPEKTVSHAIAMPINGKGKFAAVRRKDWLRLFAQLGLNPEGTLKAVIHTFDGICDKAQTLAAQLRDDPLTASPVYSKIIDRMRRRSEVLLRDCRNKSNR